MNFSETNRATVLAVTSGKGGVGKTNISTNLSIVLAAAHKRVTLIDADLGLGNLDVVMNVNSRYNLSHVIAGRRRSTRSPRSVRRAWRSSAAAADWSRWPT